MQKSNLIQIIRTFNRQERKELTHFVTANYINKRKAVILLYEYILRYIDKTPILLKKEMVFDYLFPGQEYNDQQMRYLLSFLHKIVERYLINKELLQDELQAQVYLLQSYRKRGIRKPFYKALKQTEKIVDKSSDRSHTFYEKNYLIEFEKYSFNVNTERNAPRNLQQLNDNMDIAYLTKKLRMSCVSLAHQSVYKVDYRKGLLNSIVENMEKSSFFENPVVALYYYYFKAFTTNESPYYQKFRNQLKVSETLIPANELRDIYVLAINYCIKQFNVGEEKYLREVFELYQLSLKDDLLLKDGILSHFAFKNIVGIGLRLKEFEWITQFIEDYALKLDPKYRSNYVDYNSAKLWYAQKKYKAAMQKLRRVEYDDLFLNLDAKVLLLKIYYELQELDVLESHISSFQKYVQRKKLIGYHQENYLNIIFLTKKLIELNPFDQKEKVNLKNKILTTKALAERDWLLEQLK